MEISEIARQLSEIERQALKALEDSVERDDKGLAEKSGMKIDSARRAIEWLREKGLIDVRELRKIGFAITAHGKNVIEKNLGLPEQRMFKLLNGSGKMNLRQLNEAFIDKKEFSFALGYMKKKGYVIVLANGEIELMREQAEKEFEKYLLFGFLERLNGINFEETGKFGNEENEMLEELGKRGFVEKREHAERFVKINSHGNEALKVVSTTKAREYNVYDPVPKLNIGKRQPYIQFLNKMRKKLIGLGFKEMETSLITSEFYNFDVLFQPQNHPARTWTDTYQLKRPQFGKLPERKIVEAVKAAHENGGKANSKGWGYRWNPEIAAKLMPVAHCTAHSAKQMVKGVEIPGKYFAISRCFRPDVLDATHLIEFNQMDGFVVGEGLNFRDLLGMLEQFAVEVAGAEKVKFLPDYYPFTEPSVQLSAKHPEMGWIEFAGAGIFRPEMTENLGIKEPVIAWGMGIERLFMFKMGIEDIRYLFSDDLNWLRNAKSVGVD